MQQACTHKKNQNKWTFLFHWKSLMPLKTNPVQEPPHSPDQQEQAAHTLFQFFGYCHLTFDALLHPPGAFCHGWHKERWQLNPQETQEHHIWTTWGLPGWWRGCSCMESNHYLLSELCPTLLFNLSQLSSKHNTFKSSLPCVLGATAALGEEDEALAQSLDQTPCGHTVCLVRWTCWQVWAGCP